MGILRLIAEAVLYYVACNFVARSKEDAPGFLRILIVVFLLSFVSGGLHYTIGHFWLTSFLALVISFFILWIGLGIGFFRTILAAIIVTILRMILERVFGGGQAWAWMP